MRATVSVDIDSTFPDATPPTFTSIGVLNAAGSMTSALPRGEAGALFFTAADSDGAGAYHSVAGNATRAWFRWSGDAQWSPLVAVETATDCDRVASPLGQQYRVDLSACATRSNATVDLRLAVSDAAGNTTTLTLEPAFAIVSPAGKGRAVARR